MAGSHAAGSAFLACWEPSSACLPFRCAPMQDVLSAELLQRAAAAQAQAAHAEERVAAAERRQQQLEVALNEEHATLQQRNAELALVKKVGSSCRGSATLRQRRHMRWPAAALRADALSLRRRAARRRRRRARPARSCCSATARS